MEITVKTKLFCRPEEDIDQQFFKAQVMGFPVDVCVDTGCALAMVDSSYFRKLKLPKTRSTIEISGYGGRRSSPKFSSILPVSIESKIFNIECLISPRVIQDVGFPLIISAKVVQFFRTKLNWYKVPRFILYLRDDVCTLEKTPCLP